VPRVGALAAHEDGQVALEAHPATLERPGGGGELVRRLVLHPRVEPALVGTAVPAQADRCGWIGCCGSPGLPRCAAVRALEHAERRVRAHPRVVREPGGETGVGGDLGGLVAVDAFEHRELERECARVVEPRPGFCLPSPCLDLDGVSVGAAHVLEAQVQGMQGEGAQGAVGRAVGSRVVHGQELDHLHAGAGRPRPERREIGVLADPAARAASQRGHGHGDARHRVIDVAELHDAESVADGVARCQFEGLGSQRRTGRLFAVGLACW
jgi:hypothetical protein